MRKNLRNFFDDRKGALSVLFSVSLLVLLCSIGLAIDFAQERRIKSRLQSAADAAALAAAKDPKLSDDEIRTLAMSYLKTSSLNPTIEIARGSASKPFVAVTATLEVPVLFGAFIDKSRVTIAARATAGFSQGDFELYAAVDMSASLGLAADKASRALMKKLTVASTGAAEGCYFACHEKAGWETPGPTTYTVAKTNGIKLRWDVLETAFGAFVDRFLDAADPRVANNLTKIAVAGFSTDALLLQNATNNIGDIKSALSKFPDKLKYDTRYDNVLPQMQSIIGPQGNGLNGHAKKVLLLITDGVNFDSRAWSADTMRHELCDAIKSSDISIAILDVKHLDGTGEWNFDTEVAKIYPDISPSLKACASPGLYFQAEDTDSQTITDAFATVASALRTSLALQN